MKKLLVLVFVILPLLLVTAIAAVIVTGIEEQPLVSRGGSPDAASITRGKALFDAYRNSLLRPEALTTLSASEADLNRMLTLAGRSLQLAAFEARIRPTGLIVAGTARLPKTPLGQYFNGWIAFLPSQDGLQVDTAQFGRISIPGWMVLAVFRFGLDAVLGEGRGNEALASVRQVRFAASGLTVTYRPTPELIADLGKTARDTYRKVVVNIDPAQVRVYYAQLIQEGHKRPGPGQVSFTEFIGPVLALARQRSATGNASAENAAALIAMAIYFGDSRFEKIVGEVRTGELAGAAPNVGHVRLRGRHDLVQHFTISAALAATAGLGIADVIGELKEVKDTGAGGSGFSFTDIAADRAGARFGETATSAGGAMWIQNLLAGAPLENMFFPAITGLPEFLPQEEFVRRYREVGSPEYENVIEEIDRRLSALAVFGR